MGVKAQAKNPIPCVWRPAAVETRSHSCVWFSSPRGPQELAPAGRSPPGRSKGGEYSVGPTAGAELLPGLSTVCLCPYPHFPGPVHGWAPYRAWQWEGEWTYLWDGGLPPAPTHRSAEPCDWALVSRHPSAESCDWAPVPRHPSAVSCDWGLGALYPSAERCASTPVPLHRLQVASGLGSADP
jgi:hypothetical protein